MKLLISLFVFTATVGLIACGNKGGSASTDGGIIATTPQPCNNQGLPGSYSNCQSYQPYYTNQTYNNWQYGSWYWPTAYQPQVGNCGCNSGYNPVQGPFGMACAPTAYFGAYGGSVSYVTGYSPITSGYNPSNGGYWNYGQNGGWTSQPQTYYNSAYGGNCSIGVAQGCDVRLNTCQGGSRCQPVGGGSTIGICVR